MDYGANIFDSGVKEKEANFLQRLKFVKCPCCSSSIHNLNYRTNIFHVKYKTEN